MDGEELPSPGMGRSHFPVDGEDQLSRTADQIASAHAAYCTSPGCSRSAAIHPGDPIRDALAGPTSTQMKSRAAASSPAIELNTPVSVSTFFAPPKSAAAGTYDHVGIETAVTRP